MSSQANQITAFAGVQAQGAQDATLSYAPPQPQVNVFAPLASIADSIREQVKKTENVARVTAYSELNTELDFDDNQTKTAIETMDAQGFVQEGEEKVTYDQYVEKRATLKKQKLNQFNTTFNYSKQYQEDELFVKTKMQTDAVDFEKDITLQAGKLRYLTNRLDENIKTTIYSNTGDLKTKVQNIYQVVDQLPVSETQRQEFKEKYGQKLLNASMIKFYASVDNDLAFIQRTYAERTDLRDVEIQKYYGSQAFKEKRQAYEDGLASFSTVSYETNAQAEELKSKLDPALKEMQTKAITDAGLVAVQVRQQKINLATQELDRGLSLATDPEAGAVYFQAIQEAKSIAKTADITQRVPIEHSIQVSEEAYTIVKKANYDPFAIDVKQIKSPEVLDVVLRWKESILKQQLAEAEKARKEAESSGNALEDFRTLLLQEGYASPIAITNARQKGLSDDQIKQEIKKAGALEQSPNDVKRRIAQQSGSIEGDLDSLGVGKGSQGAEFVAGIVQSYYGVSNQTRAMAKAMTPSIGKQGELMRQASKHSGLKLSLSGNKITASENGVELDIRLDKELKSLVTNTYDLGIYGASPQEALRMVMIKTLSDTGAKSFDDPKIAPAFKKSISNLVQGVLNEKKATQENTQARISTLNRITNKRAVDLRFAHINPIPASNKLPSNYLKQPEKVIGFLSTLSAVAGVTGARLSPTSVGRNTSTFHAIKNEKYPYSIGVDYSGASMTSRELALNMFTIVSAINQSKSATGRRPEIGGVAGENENSLYNSFHYVKQNKTLPVHVAKYLTTAKQKEIVRFVLNAEWVGENGSPHLHTGFDGDPHKLASKVKD